MFAKIINEDTKEVSVGFGTNTAFYQKIGMADMNVERAYNGKWYVAGYAPKESEEEKKATHKKELMAQLDDLDLKAIRALRALSAGVGTVEDKAKLEELESQAAEIRRQIKEL